MQGAIGRVRRDRRIEGLRDGEATPNLCHSKKGIAWRAPQRGLEGGVRRFCDCHDGALHRVVANEYERACAQGGRRIFQRPPWQVERDGHGPGGRSDNLPLTKDNIGLLKEQLQRSIQQKADLNKLSNQIEMTVTPEGLRIELLESKDGTFFESGSAELSESGQSILKLVSAELKQLPNKLSIEGHTDSTPYIEGAVYGNWELSVDRANAARRNMQEMGIRRDQVAQVRGYADQRLRTPKDPTDPSNRRISLIVQYTSAVETAASPPQSSGRPEGATH
jgi:chemotaxis protein MotB